jgi:hypothetical protein
MEIIMSVARAPVTERAETNRKPVISTVSFAGVAAAIALIVTTVPVAASGPIVPPRADKGHKPPHDPGRPSKPRGHHAWHGNFVDLSLRDTGWICVKAYRDRRGIWHCTAWAMR